MHAAATLVARIRSRAARTSEPAMATGCLIAYSSRSAPRTQCGTRSARERLREPTFVRGGTFTMDDRSFDSLTRQAAGGVSRRGSLITLGAAGLAATLSAPFAVEASKKHGRKKKRQQSPPPPDRCTPQVEP